MRGRRLRFDPRRISARASVQDIGKRTHQVSPRSRARLSADHERPNMRICAAFPIKRGETLDSICENAGDESPPSEIASPSTAGRRLGRGCQLGKHPRVKKPLGRAQRFQNTIMTTFTFRTIASRALACAFRPSYVFFSRRRGTSPACIRIGCGIIAESVRLKPRADAG